MVFRRINPSIIGLLLVVSASIAHADTAWSLGAASGYNVFVFSNYATPGNTDIQGAVAVGGNFTATGGLSINQNPAAPLPATGALVVGGDFSLASGQLDNGNLGNAWIAGHVSATSGGVTFQHDLHYGYLPTGAVNVSGSSTALGSTALPINFSAAATSLTQLSSAMTSLTANGVVTGNASNYTLTATGCTLCVFDLPGGSLSNITINAPSGATIIVNVSGTTDSLSNGSIAYAGGASAANTIFNFGAATSLTTSGIAVDGSILAPLATFTGMNGHINGELIAKAVTGETAEFESANIFTGNLTGIPFRVTGTPEPSTWLVMATALGGFVTFRARQRPKVTVLD